MDFDQFKIQVVDEMRERFPNLDIGIQAVSKLQGESYTGLAVSPADSNVAATMNLDYVYKRVEDGMPILVVCGDSMDGQVKDDIGLAKRLRIAATTLDGIMKVEGSAGKKA